MAMEMVLKQMQELDQQVAPARPMRKERPHFGKRFGLDLAAAREIPAAPAGARMDAALRLRRRSHGPVSASARRAWSSPAPRAIAPR